MLDAGIDLGDVPTERLEAEVASFAAELSAAKCEWELMIGELDRRETWSQWECHSMAHWLSWHCGLSKRSGREHVRVARALENLPLVTERFASGALSFSKVRALTRLIDGPLIEAEMVELAIVATAAQLDEIAAARTRVQRLTDPKPERDHHQSWSLILDDDGGGTITIRASADVLAEMLCAVDTQERETRVAVKAGGAAGRPILFALPKASRHGVSRPSRRSVVGDSNPMPNSRCQPRSSSATIPRLSSFLTANVRLAMTRWHRSRWRARACTASMASRSANRPTSDCAATRQLRLNAPSPTDLSLAPGPKQRSPARCAEPSTDATRPVASLRADHARHCTSITSNGDETGVSIPSTTWCSCVITTTDRSINRAGRSTGQRTAASNLSDPTAGPLANQAARRSCRACRAAPRGHPTSPHGSPNAAPRSIMPPSAPRTTSTWICTG